MSVGPSASREALAESDEPLRIGSTTVASGLSSASGVVGTLPVSDAAGAVVGVVPAAVVAVVRAVAAGGGAGRAGGPLRPPLLAAGRAAALQVEAELRGGVGGEDRDQRDDHDGDGHREL